MQNLSEQTVLITGSSRGIGAATALAFAKEGCRVIISFLEQVGSAEKLQKECLAQGAKSADIIHLDVTDSDSIKSALRSILLKYGGIDILVNNAGVIRWKKFENQTEEDIDEQIAVNLTGLIKTTKFILPHIRSTIINIASGAGSHPVNDLSVYCATKYGVKGFTAVLAMEKPSLNIYSVSPTMTSTEMTDYHGMPPEKVAKVIVQTAKDGYGRKSGSDIRVLEVMNKSQLEISSK